EDHTLLGESLQRLDVPHTEARQLLKSRLSDSHPGHVPQLALMTPPTPDPSEDVVERQQKGTLMSLQRDGQFIVQCRHPSGEADGSSILENAVGRSSDCGEAVDDRECCATRLDLANQSKDLAGDGSSRGGEFFLLRRHDPLRADVLKSEGKKDH